MLRTLLKSSRTISEKLFRFKTRKFLKFSIFPAFESRCLFGTAIKEPSGPCVQTEVPGPNSKALLKNLNELQVSLSEKKHREKTFEAFFTRNKAFSAKKFVAIAKKLHQNSIDFFFHSKPTQFNCLATTREASEISCSTSMATSCWMFTRKSARCRSATIIQKC